MISQAWTQTTFGEATLIRQGKYLAKTEMANAIERRSPIPIHGANGIIGWTSKSMYGHGVPLVTCRGSNSGMILWAEGPLWVSNNAMAILPKSGQDLRFLYYVLLNSPPYEFVSGSAQPQITMGDLSRKSLLLPPPSDQRAIAATLGALDEKIELNRRMNETLEAMARALFRDWFVDFGPTRAKMAGVAHYLSPALWDLFPDNLDHEGKPEGWKVKPLSDAFDLLMGQSPPGDTYNDDGDGLPFFQGRTDFGFRFPENRKYCSEPTRVAEKGDTLVSVRAPVGDINIAAERCCIGRGVAALRHKDDRPSFTYCTAWALQEELRQYENTGTVFGAINRKQFEALPTVDPGSDLLKAFEEMASAMDQQIERNERETRVLAQTRDLLLPRLMSGELRVADVDPAERETAE